MKITPEDKIIIILNDNIIQGSTRIQKYAFLISKQCKTELDEIKNSYPNFEWYEDWIKYSLGPESKSLKKDLEICIKNKRVQRNRIDNINNYSLTQKGLVRLREIIPGNQEEIKKINKKVQFLQDFSIFGLAKCIHDIDKSMMWNY